MQNKEIRIGSKWLAQGKSYSFDDLLFTFKVVFKTVDPDGKDVFLAVKLDSDQSDQAVINEFSAVWFYTESMDSVCREVTYHIEKRWNKRTKSEYGL